MKAVKTSPDQGSSRPLDFPENPDRLPFIRILFVFIGLVLFFVRPLYDLVQFASESELYSYILLVPCIVFYLVWEKRKTLPPASAPSRFKATLFLVAGALVVGTYWLVFRSDPGLPRQNYLAGMMLAFVLLMSGAWAFILGRRTFSALSRPLAFFAFIIPFPIFLEKGMNTELQHSSAVVAYWMFKLANTPVFYHDLIFQLSTIRIEVAPECSGIRSTVALFLTSLLAGYFFLRTPWKCGVLALAVIPLAMLRNGFRIFTLGELCVHMGPQMIDSDLHHRGGPLFFALSLIPFSLFLWWLRKTDRRVSVKKTSVL